jgi:hypothetical protein
MAHSRIEKLTSSALTSVYWEKKRLKYTKILRKHLRKTVYIANRCYNCARGERKSRRGEKKREEGGRPEEQR